jgi:hypothetical protein
MLSSGAPTGPICQKWSMTVSRAIPPASASRARCPSVGASWRGPPLQVKSAMWNPRSIGTDDPILT